MLYRHMKLTEREAYLRFNGQFNADISLHEEIENQAGSIASFMADGNYKTIFSINIVLK